MQPLQEFIESRWEIEKACTSARQRSLDAAWGTRRSKFAVLIARSSVPTMVMAYAVCTEVVTSGLCNVVEIGGVKLPAFADKAAGLQLQ